MAANDYFDPLWTAKVTVPVTRVGNRWEFLYGGDVPVREGTVGDLVIHGSQITDSNFLKAVTQETVVKILEEGAPLLVALSDQSRDGVRVGPQPWPDIQPTDVPLGTTRFARVQIGPTTPPARAQKTLDAPALEGGLWLKVKGLDRCELNCSTMKLPGGSLEPTAISLNHAFTLLSKQFETHRISNTGNVYDRCFYQEESGRWYPLSDLREGIRARVERGVIDAAWSKIEAALGWCRLPQYKLESERRGRRRN